VTSFLLVLTSMTLNDLEPLKLGFLVFFCDFRLQLNCTKMTGDGSGQLAYDIFSIERTF